MSQLTRRLFGLSDRQVSFERRGFRGGKPAIKEHIETIGRAFLSGYHAALLDPRPEPLRTRLEDGAAAYRGFAYEGAAMGLVLLDILLPGRRNRFEGFFSTNGTNYGAAHVYMGQVGAGWALARVPFGNARVLADLDPTLRWLAYDGWGFHQGFFHWRKAIEGRQQVPRRVGQGYARRAFDQGLGRSLWFVEGAEAGRIAKTIGSFAETRRSDLWSGVGLAAAYAGGVDQAQLEDLRTAARGFSAELAQGAAFGAETRHRGANLGPHTELACEVIWGQDAERVVELTRRTGSDLPAGTTDQPDYEVWRQRLRQAFEARRRTAAA